MPWRSIQQARWGHSPAGEKALGGPAKVKEWDQATTPGSLPKKVGPLEAAAKKKGSERG